jgi:hypothetical protein
VVEGMGGWDSNKYCEYKKRGGVPGVGAGDGGSGGARSPPR